MPAQSLFTTTTTTTPSSLSLLPDPHDAKARTEYERDRQKAHKHHDIRKKYHPHHQKSPTSSSSRQHLASSGHWRNLVRDMVEDVSSPSVPAREVDDRQEDIGKENSPVTVSFEDLVRAAAVPPAGPQASPKPRQGRSPRSRYSPNDVSAALSRVNLSSPPTPPSPSHLLLPMMLLSPYTSTLHLSSEDDSASASFDWSEFSSPGADDWMMDETEDGCLRFVCTTAATNSPTTPCGTAADSSLTSSVILVEKSVW